MPENISLIKKGSNFYILKNSKTEFKTQDQQIALLAAHAFRVDKPSDWCCLCKEIIRRSRIGGGGIWQDHASRQ